MAIYIQTVETDANGVATKSVGAAAHSPTAALTTITHSAAATADYAIQDLVTASSYGFVTANEAQTVLAVIANLQTRVAELEAALA